MHVCARDKITVALATATFTQELPNRGWCWRKASGVGLMFLFQRLFGQKRTKANTEEQSMAAEEHSGGEGSSRTSPLANGQAVELGDINYVNLDKHRKHGNKNYT
jgi:hypothetical protein